MRVGEKPNDFTQPLKVGPDEDNEWDDTKYDSISVQVKALMGNRKFFEMEPISIDSSKIIQQDSIPTLNVEFLFNGKKYLSKPFQLDFVEYDDSFCCTGFIEDYDCKLFPEHFENIWIVSDKKILLLEYGIIHQANGCDRGPFFKIINYTKK